MTILFEDVTRTAGIKFIRGLTFGASWGNFNNDDFPDLYVSNHFDPASLYLNQGDGTFIDIASEVFLFEEIEGDTHAAAWADFDNDGDQDLIQLLGAVQGTGSDPNKLYINEDGVLRDRAVEFNLDYPEARARTPLWLDFDNDGLLDVVINATERPDGEAPPTIFRQTAEGTFEDVRSQTGLELINTRFALLSDLSGDGNLDLIPVGTVANSSSRVSVFDLTSLPFANITSTRISPKSDNDVVIADFDGDLLPDIYVARNRFDSEKGFVDDFLFINTGSGFVDRSAESGINTVPHPGRSVVAGDFDNDMDLDIYIDGTTNVNQPNILLENQGDGTFVYVPGAGGAEGIVFGGAGDSVVTADYDLDGFLDLFLVNENKNLSIEENNISNQLFRNLGNENSWLEIDLEGVVSNRDGIGAKVFATAGNITQLREQNNGMHRSAQNHQRIHFGLGNNARVDLLEVQWSSGVVQKLGQIDANQLIDVTEGIGLEGNDTIIGSSGNDVLAGNAGKDLLEGLSGDDFIQGEDGKDTLDGGAGDDTLYGGNFSDIMFGENDRDLLFGERGKDTLYGGAGDDTLDGGVNSDNLDGGAGDDILISGKGIDTVTGGKGADIFLYTIPQDGRDTITDFSPDEDKIDLSQILSGKNFSSTTPFDDYITLIQSTNDTKIMLDHNGDFSGGGRLIADLQNVLIYEISESNFVLS